MKNPKNIKSRIKKIIESEDHCKTCFICDKKPKKKGRNWSPYSVCYDPMYKKNTWGGDSHEYVGLLCDDCMRTLCIFARANIMIREIGGKKCKS